MRYRITFLILALLCFRSSALEGGTLTTYADELAARARERRTAYSQGWLRLGHWREDGDGYQSEADGPAFFLSPTGDRDPEAELEATLKGFLAPSSDRSADHAQCRFPARLRFLVEAVSIDLAHLPPQPCPELESFWTRMSPRSVAVVFSYYYMNNPASAFGHTFLRVAKAEYGAPGDRAPGDRFDLIDQGVSYAAEPNETNLFAYAAKAFFGGFRGDWTARPYFYKVREYADYESRDLWEYELALTPAEVVMLVAHLWELGHTWFDYYYLTENCSYHVLGAIEAAAPRLELLRHVGKIVLPADTVKALFANPGLVRAVRFRPSVRTQLSARIAPLSDEQLDAVFALAEGEVPDAFRSATREERARWLDAAVDVVDVRHGREFIEGAETPALKLRYSLLEQRSETGVIAEPLVVPPPAAGGPERGHGSMRLGLGGGTSSRDGPLIGLEGRVALHDLVDPPAGFPLRTQLEFLKFRASYATRDAWFRLDDASLVEATSLNVFDRVEQRVAWKLRAGATRVLDAGCRDCIAGRFEVGGGTAAVLMDGALSALLTVDTELLASPPLHGAGGTAFRPGLGPGALLRVLVGERYALLGTATWRWLPDAAPDTTFQLGATGRVHLGRVSLACDVRRSPLATEAMLSLLVYGG